MTTEHHEPEWTTEESRLFRRSVRRFVERAFGGACEHRPPRGGVDRETWLDAGQSGLLLADVPERYGGGGGTFVHEAVVVEELARGGVHAGFGIQSIVANYILAFGTEEQRRRWLPAMARGEAIAAIAMTEASGGSDLQGIRTAARRQGDHYVLSGSKSFITNGADADLVCVAARTDPATTGPRALSLLVVESGVGKGIRVGKPLKKVGRPLQDTRELFFDDVMVPAANLLGGVEGRGLFQMMEQLSYERLAVALGAVAAAERAVEITTAYAKERNVAGKPLIELQNTRFKLAECATATRAARAFIDDCIRRHLAGRLDAVGAAMAKYWLTEMQCRVIDECVQLHGGYGYMEEFEIARMWADARAQRIYAGSNEVMKEMIGWSL